MGGKCDYKRATMRDPCGDGIVLWVELSEGYTRPPDYYLQHHGNL